MRRLPALLLVLAACADEPEGPPPVTEEAARARRLRCEFGPGALPAETLHTGAPVSADIPVDHVLLVMQENRSFDHYFGALSHAGVDAAPPGVTNPDAASQPVGRYHETRYCVRDTPHSWRASHRQWNEGANDGFAREAEPDGARALGYYDENDLPFYYALARSFAISDRHFCSLLGPTWPNRMFYFAGTSWGMIRNLPPPTQDAEHNRYPNLFERLKSAGVSWKVYAVGPWSPSMFLLTFVENSDLFVPLDQFFVDLGAGALPAVAVVEANYLGQGTRTDEHAPGDVQLGQAFSARVVNALIASSAWPRSVLFLTYDEHGGFYDHVPPPAACVPDAIEPLLEGGDPPGRFDRYGFRVPLIAVSPFARRGYVSHLVSDLTSILRFVELRFNLPAMTARDANAEPLLDLFDFARPDLAPPVLPDAVIDAAEQARCAREFP